MPRGPGSLPALNHVYLTTIGAGSSPDNEALLFIADTLRQGTVPADLRAALLRAAAMIPGVTTTDNQATLDGQTGTAIGRVESENGLRQEITIDPTSGRMIVKGEGAVVAIPQSSIAAGDVWRWSSGRTSVVDAALPVEPRTEPATLWVACLACVQPRCTARQRARSGGPPAAYQPHRWRRDFLSTYPVALGAVGRGS